MFSAALPEKVIGLRRRQARHMPLFIRPMQARRPACPELAEGSKGVPRFTAMRKPADRERWLTPCFPAFRGRSGRDALPALSPSKGAPRGGLNMEP